MNPSKEFDLMERIQSPDFCALSDEEALSLVESIQNKRIALWSEAMKARKSGATKSATKNKKRKKNGSTSLKAEDDLTKLLKQMSPEQLQAFKQKMGLE
jgi:hypothetical protein